MRGISLNFRVGSDSFLAPHYVYSLASGGDLVIGLQLLLVADQNPNLTKVPLTRHSGTFCDIQNSSPMHMMGFVW